MVVLIHSRSYDSIYKSQVADKRIAESIVHANNGLSSAQRQTRIYSPTDITLLRSDDVFDDLFVKIWKHALERSASQQSAYISADPSGE